MTIYQCPICARDLSREVEIAINDDGPGVLNVDDVVEGRLRDEGDSSSGSVSALAQAASEGRGDLIPIVVTCPKDGDVVFYVRRRGN
jgi:hypothetical protein